MSVYDALDKSRFLEKFRQSGKVDDFEKHDT